MELMDLDSLTEATLYKPLQQDEFRLALLEPGERDAPIIAHLVPANINSPPEYDGLSYVWGDARDLVPICCGGCSTNVTVNLHWALNRVRLADRPRLVWADALCINQNDPQERSQQVSLMGRIYFGARLVLACMGDDRGGGAADVASLLSDYGPVLARPQYMQDLLQLWFSGCIKPPDQDPRWQSLGPVMRLPYFQRAWVLQEVGLAKNPRVVYGSVEFSYRDLMQTVIWIQMSGDFAAQLCIGALLIHTQWTDWSDRWAVTGAHEQCRFVDLLDHGALLECQDPRDHIYAFLGHPLAKTVGIIVPDYTQDKLQIYKEASVLLFRDAGVRALSSVEHSTDTIREDFPSWVIRWDVGFILNNIYTHPSTEYRANLGLSVGSVAHVENDVLHLDGVVVDVIRTVYAIRLFPQCMRVMFRNTAASVEGTILDLIQHLEDPNVPSAYPNARAESLAYTLSTFCYEPADMASSTSGVRRAWTEYLKWQRQTGTQDGLPSAHRFWRAMAASCRGRAFFITKRGHYGLGSHISQPGDVCCITHGSTVPFVLRPSLLKGQGYYKLVGEAYVHGIMQGESVEMLRSGQLKEEDLLIY